MPYWLSVEGDTDNYETEQLAAGCFFALDVILDTSLVVAPSIKSRSASGKAASEFIIYPQEHDTITGLLHPAAMSFSPIAHPQRRRRQPRWPAAGWSGR